MPATFSKPTKTARWADTGTRVEPSEAKKNTGWIFEEIPPFSFFNFLQGITGDWHQWLDERLFDGASIDDFVLKHPGTDTVGLELKSGRLEIQGDANFALDLTGANPQIQLFDDSLDAFSGNALIEFDRINNQFEFYTSGTPGTSIVRIKKEGMEIRSGQSGVGGGLVVGGAQTLTRNFIYLGQDGTASAFSLQWKDSTDVRLNFVGTDDDFLKYDRSADELQLFIANTEEWTFGAGFVSAVGDLEFRRGGVNEMKLRSTGLEITNGLNVGFTGGTITNDAINIVDDDFRIEGSASVPAVWFDKGIGSGTTGIFAVRSSGDTTIRASGSDSVRIFGANHGIAVRGGIRLGSGSVTTEPQLNRLEIEDETFSLEVFTPGADPRITFDTDDRLVYDRGLNEWQFQIAGATKFGVRSTGTRLNSLSKTITISPLTGIGSNVGVSNLTVDGGLKQIVQVPRFEEINFGLLLPEGGTITEIRCKVQDTFNASALSTALMNFFEKSKSLNPFTNNGTLVAGTGTVVLTSQQTVTLTINPNTVIDPNKYYGLFIGNNAGAASSILAVGWIEIDVDIDENSYWRNG